MTPAADPIAPARTPMAVAYTLVFIAFVDTFALLPTIGPYATALGATQFGVGLAVGAYSVTDIAFNAVGGVMLDRKGRRRLVVLGFGIITIAVLLYPMVTSIGGLVGVRLLHGVGGGILIPALYTVIGDLSRTGARGRAMGRVGAVIGTVAVIAPGVAGATRARSGFNAVFIGLAVIMAIGLVLSVIKVKETLDPPARDRSQGLSIGSLLKIKQLQIACVSVFGFTVGFGSLSAFLSDRLEDMGHSPAVSGGMFTALALVAVVLMLTRLSSRVDTQGVQRPVMIGLPPIIVGLTLIGISEQVGVIGMGMILFGVGFGIIYPAVSGATAAAAAAPGRGRAFGIFSIAYSLGFALGPPLLGFLSDRADISPFLGAAAISIVTLVAVVFVARSGRDSATHGQA